MTYALEAETRGILGTARAWAWGVAVVLGLLLAEGSGARAAQNVTYTYDPVGRLTRATYDDSLTTTYTYDPGGNLLEVVTAPAVSGVPETPTGGALPAVVALGPLVPNPMSESLTLAYQLPEPVEVRIQVYDVAGRQVRDLLHASMPAGYHGVMWDGRDDRGHRLACGTYFLRARLGPYETARTLSLFR